MRRGLIKRGAEHVVDAPYYKFLDISGALLQMARRPEAYSHLTNALFNLLHDHLRAAGSVADPRSHLQDCIGCTLSEAQALVDHLTSLLSSGATSRKEGVRQLPQCQISISRLRRARPFPARLEATELPATHRFPLKLIF